MNRGIDFIKKYLGFGFSFLFTKGIVYFVPLLLADLLTTYEFGILEYALAGLGFVVNALINLGVPNAYPYFTLKLNDYKVENGFKLHPLWLFLLFISNQIAYYSFGLSFEIYLAFNISYVIANQVLYSTIFKSREEPIKAIFLDSGIYLVLSCIILLASLKVLKLSVAVINNAILLYAGVFVFLSVYKYIRVNKASVLNHYKAILGYSSNILLSTLFIFLITASGRILVEYFFGFDEVAIYGFYFRLAAIVVMIYQMINILLFKKLYTVLPDKLDRYFSAFFLFMTVLGYVVYLIVPYVLSPFSSFFNDTFLQNKTIYFLLVSQMVMWVATALNSSIIDRENLAKSNNLKFFILLLVSCLVLFALRDKLKLDVLVFIHYSTIYLACLIQYFSLTKKHIYFKRSGLVLSGCYLFTFAFYVLI